MTSPKAPPTPGDNEVGPDTKLEKLKLYYDYTKWHVGLYSGSILGVWLLVQPKPWDDWWWVQSLATVALVLAAACAGAICGTIPEVDDLDALNGAQLSVLGLPIPLTGGRARCAEKWLFWPGAIALIAIILFKIPAPESAKIECTCPDAQTIAPSAPSPTR